MKMAKASEEELTALLNFIEKIEELDESGADEYDLGEWLTSYLQEHRGLPFSAGRIIFGYRTMFETACDPKEGALAWKPEIKRVLETHPKLLKLCQELLGHLQHARPDLGETDLKIYAKSIIEESGGKID